jgi:tRNA (cmo5U34)-methyltransferase
MNNRIAVGFDFLVPFYDRLARLIIGNEIITSQLHFLKCFRGCTRILILGGGSGWLLDSLCKACPELRIDYIDLSGGMINAARKRLGNTDHVQFIQGTENDIPDRLYDGVITNFYLDMFDEDKLTVVIEKIKSVLNNPTIWVITDFVNDQKGHRIMLWWMYRFFRFVTRIDAAHLPDWQNQMSIAGGKLLESKVFKNGFITTNRYQITTMFTENRDF